MQKTTSKPAEFTGRHMLAIMVTFFGVVISVNMFMAYKALSTWTGLVVPNSYVASQHFEIDKQKRAEQAKLGWQVSLSVDDNQLAVDLRDEKGATINDAAVMVRLTRPLTDRDDMTITLKGADAGRFVSVETLPAGDWLADVSISRAGNEPDWRQSYRFTVAASR